MFNYNLGILFQKYNFTDTINLLSSLITENRSVRSGNYKKLFSSYLDKLDPEKYKTYNSTGELINTYKSKIDEEK